ncbi:MAG: hypothetical protein NTW55_02185 [Planctomycetota bacterium]|nr:hypothetical protein [Planctomycetota bacterium]
MLSLKILSQNITEVSLLKLIRNFLISIFSMGWIYLCAGSVAGLFYWLKDFGKIKANFIECDVSYQIGLGILSIGILWMFFALIFWVCTFTYKLCKKSKWGFVNSVVLTAISVGWCLPFYRFVYYIFRWLFWIQASEVAKDNKIEYSNLFETSIVNLKISAFWLMLVVVIWAFFAANKLWPPKCKKQNN